MALLPVYADTIGVMRTSMMHRPIGIIGGEPARFAPFVKLYRDAARLSGHDAATSPYVHAG